ncbi:Bacterial alpha-L-rhamnosidase [Klebsiella variicola]|nr:Bacterial alpha-L-rhamnosidase [Klebsiella variicola]
MPAFKDNIHGEFHISSQANSFVTTFGAASPEQSQQAAKYLADQRMLKGSVYSSLFALTTMAEHGQAEEAVNQITGMNTDGTLRQNSHNWRHMMELGSGSTMEAWNESDDFTVSHSHAWGTSPAIVIPESLFGIKPLKPAWAEFQVKPVPAGLKYASIRVPTIRGPINASYKVDENKWQINISVPVNTSAHIYVPAKSIDTIKESDMEIKDISGLKVINEKDGYVEILAGSGDYKFTSIM